jgi:hypothetical protein
MNRNPEETDEKLVACKMKLTNLKASFNFYSNYKVPLREYR